MAERTSPAPRELLIVSPLRTFNKCVMLNQRSISRVAECTLNPALHAGNIWRSLAPPHGRSALRLHESGELSWIDGDKQRLAAGQDFTFLIQDLAHVYVFASLHADLS